jgi:hypothetical protein
MYSKIETRILSVHQNDMSAEELANLYYQIDTEVREGSTQGQHHVPTALRVVYRWAAAEAQRAKLRSENTPPSHQRVGALMYADDLVLLADSPGELQLMMDVTTVTTPKTMALPNQ